jgi:hypothetical protein
MHENIGCTKDSSWLKCVGHCSVGLSCILFYSILFYSTVGCLAPLLLDTYVAWWCCQVGIFTVLNKRSYEKFSERISDVLLIFTVHKKFPFHHLHLAIASKFKRQSCIQDAITPVQNAMHINTKQDVFMIYWILWKYFSRISKSCKMSATSNNAQQITAPWPAKNAWWKCKYLYHASQRV